MPEQSDHHGAAFLFFHRAVIDPHPRIPRRCMTAVLMNVSALVSAFHLRNRSPERYFMRSRSRLRRHSLVLALATVGACSSPSIESAGGGQNRGGPGDGTGGRGPGGG